MWAVLGAMDSEIKIFLARLKGKEQSEWNGFSFYTGTLAGEKVVLSRTGVGKALSALVTQKIIDKFAPKAIILTGIAGSLRAELSIGDILFARDCLQWDLDATKFGLPRGQIPHTSYRILKCDTGLLKTASGFNSGDANSFTGRILTGDTFLTGAGLPEYSFLTGELDGWAVEMEGASVGLTAAVNGIPFLLIRVISDNADGGVPKDFKAFLRDASGKACSVVEYILKNSRY